MNAIRECETTGKEEHVYCPQCFGELLLGEQQPDGSIVTPADNEVVIETFTEGATPLVMCRDCNFTQAMAAEDVYVYDGPAIADPYAQR